MCVFHQSTFGSSLGKDAYTCLTSWDQGSNLRHGVFHFSLFCVLTLRRNPTTDFQNKQMM